MRFALDYYIRKGENNATQQNDDKIAKLFQREEQKLNDMYAKIDEKIAQFQPSNQIPTNDRAAQIQVIENIVKSHPEGVSTGIIKSCTTWSREEVTGILLELKTAGKIKHIKENWSVA